MNDLSHIHNRASQSWDLSQLIISHNVIDYHEMGKAVVHSDAELVRLHFGLAGSYAFTCKELNASFDLSGHHNNIMYTHELTLEVENKSTRIETFGINIRPESFVNIAQNGNEPLKKFADKVVQKENTLFSPVWKTNPFSIQQVINEIIHCPFKDELRKLFLWSKSIELLVLQAALYASSEEHSFMLSHSDKQKLIDAKEILNERMDDPPTLSELSRLVMLNEYKLKKGFKALFGITVFGYVHQSRMNLAKRLLLGTDKSAKEIAYETGYSSPQYFSRAFKKEFGVSPNHIRKNPDSASFS